MTIPDQDIPSGRPRTVVISGASDGIGRAAATGFARRGDRVVLLGRNEAKTAAAARAIMSATGNRTITWHIADLSSLEAVAELADRLRDAHPRIDVLVNNAGAMFRHRELTPEGIERTVALNHLAAFALTLRLLPSLATAAEAHPPARVITVSSRAHQHGRADLDDLQFAHGYRAWRAYGTTKLYNLWFTTALAARVPADRLLAVAMHPGVVRTRFATNNGAWGRWQRRIMDLVSVTPEVGADTILWLADAEAPRSFPGSYWVRRQRTTPSRTARNLAAAERLWTMSADLTGLDADALVRAAFPGRTPT